MRLLGFLRAVFRRTTVADETVQPTIRYSPIEDYALIGDRVSAALVSRDGSIDWGCFPRMDAPATFARILDADRGGSWRIAPARRYTSSRRYRPDTAILETSFETGTGTVRLTDFMPLGTPNARRAADGTVVRVVQGLTGRVEMATQFDPRFDFGRAALQWESEPRHGVRAMSGAESVTLHAPDVSFAVGERGATGSFDVRAGDEVAFVMSYRCPPSLLFGPALATAVPGLLEHTDREWREWAGQCTYRGPLEAAVRRSLITLKLLDYAPTGAIAAAPTTSLPETIGGIRNWDYRYCWIRDAAFTLYAFLVSGYAEEAATYLDWVLDVTSGDPASLRVLYGLNGEPQAPEVELAHLEGYMGSRPVRIGNGAQNQLQLDMYGEILDCAYLMLRNGGVLSNRLWDLLRRIVDHVCQVWELPDHGPWEIRSEPRHFVYSKVLCWVAVDRGIRLAGGMGKDSEVAEWMLVRDSIREEVLARGYNEDLGAFTAAYDGEDLDAAVLALPLRRFIDANDPRMASTIQRVRSELAIPGAEHLLRRVSSDFPDGLHGREGAFMLCSFWLADCLTMQGKADEAEALLQALLAHANDVGLYAEMVEPLSGRHLGNFPQAFTHIALVAAAGNLARARARSAAAAQATEA